MADHCEECGGPGGDKTGLRHAFRCWLFDPGHHCWQGIAMHGGVRCRGCGRDYSTHAVWRHGRSAAIATTSRALVERGRVA